MLQKSIITYFLLLMLNPLFGQNLTIEEMRIEADKGDLESQNNLGYAYQKGDGVPKDLEEGIKWYKKAAESGYPKSQSNLGNCYLAGRGIKKDTVEAVKWLEKAASQGYPKAQYNLAHLYETGCGVLKQDSKKAGEWYLKASENGNSDAMNNLAGMYMRGEGVEQNLKEAVRWSEIGAKKGNELAQAFIGQLYLTTIPDVIVKDRSKALYWLSRAAKQGLDGLDSFLAEAEPQNKEEMEAKMSDDLCSKFKGSINEEPEKLSFTRFYFFGKQIFDTDYPDYQKLLKFAPKVKPDELKKEILVQTFKTCPTYGEKYGFSDTESPYYAKLNESLCDCVTKEYSKTHKIDSEMDEESLMQHRDKCLNILSSKDSIFSKNLQSQTAYLLEKDKSKKNKQSDAAEMTDYFMLNLYGSFYMQCSFMQNLYAKSLLNDLNNSKNNILLIASDRLRITQNIIMSMKQNRLDILKRNFRDEMSFNKNKDMIDQLVTILRRQPKIAPMHYKQEIVKEGFIEKFGMLNAETKAVEYVINMTFDKSGNMNELLGLEFIPLIKIPQDLMKKLNELASSMKIGR
jgi:Sel1 repeat